MVEHKHSNVLIKAKGSEALKSRLHTGNIKEISKAFGIEYMKAYNVIAGKYYGDKRIVDCAERIVSFYDSVQLENNVSNIINSYGSTNQ